MDLAIFQDISTDKATNSVTIHHSEGAFTFVKDDLIKLDFPQQRKTTFFEESVFKILRYLTLFCLFGGFFNLFIYTKSHLAPDHWKYLTSSLFILILSIPLPWFIKDINRILKSPRPNTFIERNNQTNEMSKTIFAIIFILGLIWTVFAYNSIWMLLSVLIISLISLFILVLIILFGTARGLKFVERLVHFYTDKEPKVMTLTLKNQIVEYRITDRTRNQNTLDFLTHYASKPSNAFSYMIALFVSMSVILISIFIFFKMDSPFWWRNLDFHVHGSWLLSYNCHNYLYADHNVLQVFADGFASNLFVGTFILLALFLILVYLCSYLFIIFGLPGIITFNILKRISTKVKFEIHVGFLLLIYIVGVISMIGGEFALFEYFKKTNFYLTQKIMRPIILISPLLTILILYIGSKFKNSLIASHDVFKFFIVQKHH